MRCKPLVILGFVLAATFAGDAASRTQHNRILVTKNGSGSGTVTSDAPGDNATPLNCGSVCSGLFKAVTVTLTATPDGGSTFDGWAGACSGTATTCSIYVSATPESGFTYGLSATFNSSVRYQLTVATAGSGKGTVQSVPSGLACPGACAKGYPPGTSVALTATPDAASAFMSWGGACAGTQPTCTVTMDQAKSVTAAFTSLSFTVSVSRIGTGRGNVTSTPAGIACGGTCSADLGGTVHLAAAAATGSSFKGWGGACSGTGSCSLTVDAAKSVTARFDDTRAPVVKARASAGERGHTARLRYSVSDASGQAKARVTVTRDRTALAVLRHPVARTNTGDYVSWRVPSRVKSGAFRFCVVAVDPAGNRSVPSCAALTIT